MIYYLSFYLKSYFSFFNVIHYISVRAVASLFTAFLCSLLLGSKYILVSQRLFKSKSRPFTPETHRAKDSKPTMGGLFILSVVIVNSLLWCDVSCNYVFIFLFCITAFGLIGFFDDFNKIKYNRGISALHKFVLQIIAALATAIALIHSSFFSTQIVFPFLKTVTPDIGLFFIPWAVFILVGCSNAVNLTDGLDGLAIGSLLPNFALYSLICYVAGHSAFTCYLQIPFTASSEVTIIGATLIGASLGFLWFNTYPAHIFMGDVGSLALGAGLALMALIAKQELLLAISGGLFVLETISVIAQVISVKIYNKRIFKMAPIHHHFELLGYPESTITARFGIISLLLCLLAFITLKLR